EENLFCDVNGDGSVSSIDYGIALNNLNAVLVGELNHYGTERTSLGRFIEAYVAKRTDVKPATKEIWRQSQNGLTEFFGAGKAIPDVTAGAADDGTVYVVNERFRKAAMGNAGWHNCNLRTTFE